MAGDQPLLFGRGPRPNFRMLNDIMDLNENHADIMNVATARPVLAPATAAAAAAAPAATKRADVH